MPLHVKVLAEAAAVYHHFRAGIVNHLIGFFPLLLLLGSPFLFVKGSATAAEYIMAASNKCTEAHGLPVRSRNEYLLSLPDASRLKLLIMPRQAAYFGVPLSSFPIKTAFSSIINNSMSDMFLLHKYIMDLSGHCSQCYVQKTG